MDAFVPIGRIAGASAARREVRVLWQRLVTDAGSTCSRCASTGDSVQDAADLLRRTLSPLGLRVTVEERALDRRSFLDDPSASNRIWVDGTALEDWLGGSVSGSTCCAACEGNECRTVEVAGVVHEAIPARLIVAAGLMAAGVRMARSAETAP